MAAKAVTVFVWSKEPGASSKFPMWVQGLKYLGHPLLLSHAGAGSEMKQPALEPLLWRRAVLQVVDLLITPVLAPNEHL